MNAMTYFILGSHPELSTAELEAVLGTGLKVEDRSDSALLAQPIGRNLDELQERLAGVVKIGRVIGELPRWSREEAAELVAGFALQAAGKNKISFGLSVYELGDAQRTREVEKDLDTTGLEVKRLLKEGSRPVRYVKAREPRLSSAVIEMNGLLSSGGEFVFLAASDRIYVGQTETIQNFRAWEARDFGRPARDAKAGMLPPKLARLMINLSGVNPSGATLLDPFCGSGTILMEGILMEFERIIGSDVSPKAIEGTQSNLMWLVERFNLSNPKLELFTTPAMTLSKILSPANGGFTAVNALVTEVYLGSPRRAPAGLSEIQYLERELLPLYESSFAALKPLLASTARAVVAFPAFKKTDGAWHRLPIQNLLSKLGYNVEQQFLYHRADQLVARDIVVMTR